MDTAAAVLAATEGDDDVCGGTSAVGGSTGGTLVDVCDTLLVAKAALTGGSTAYGIM